MPSLSPAVASPQPLRVIRILNDDQSSASPSHLLFCCVSVGVQADLRGLSLDLPSFTDRNGVEEDAETSASKQQWRQEWRQAVGLDAASPRSKRRSLRGRECPERHNKDDDAEAETCQRRERDVLFNERYEEGAKGGDEEENKEDREDGESRDLREEPARFLSREIPEKVYARFHRPFVHELVRKHRDSVPLFPIDSPLVGAHTLLMFPC